MTTKKNLTFLFALAMLLSVFFLTASAVKEGWCVETGAGGVKENVLYIKDTLCYDYSELMSDVKSSFGISNCYVYDGDTRLKGETVSFTNGNVYNVKKATGNNQTIGQFRVYMFYEADVSVEMPDGFTQGDAYLTVNGVSYVSGEPVGLVSEGDGADIFEIKFSNLRGYTPVLKVSGSEEPVELTSADGRYTYSHNFGESKSTSFSLSYEKTLADVVLPDDFTEVFYFDRVDEISVYIRNKINTAVFTDENGDIKETALFYDLTEALSSISADRDGEKQTVSFTVSVPQTDNHLSAERIYTLQVVGKIHTLCFGDNITVRRNGEAVMSGDTLSEGEYTVTVQPDEGRYIKNIYINGKAIELNEDLSDGKVCSFSFKAENTDIDYIISVETDAVAPSDVKIIIDNKSKYVYEKDPVFTCTVEGLDAGDVVENLVLVREKGSKAGRYVISATYAENKKYRITVIEGSLTVTHNPDMRVTDKSVEPECEKTGLTEGSHCSGCGEIFSSQRVIPAKGHSYSKTFTIDKKATYKAAGSESRHCIRKGCTAKTQVRAVPMLKLSKVKSLKATAYTATVKLSWEKVKGAEKYEVYYSSDGKKWNKSTVKKNSLTLKKLKSAMAFKIKVRAVAGKNKGTFSTVLSVVTKPAKVSLKALKSTEKGIAEVSWKKLSTATGYEVSYSTSKKFTKKTTKTATVKKVKTTKTTVKKLSKGKKYYFRIRAYKTVGKKKIYGAWSSVKTVKVK